MALSKNAFLSALLFAPIALFLACGDEEFSNVPDWMATEIREWASDCETATIGDTVTFSVLKVGGSAHGIDQCKWSFGDGAEFVEENCDAVRHAYDKPGNYAVALELTNEYGATSRKWRTVQIVRGEPVVNAGDSALKCFVNTSCAFAGMAEDLNDGADSGPGKIVSYWWDYDGDGAFDDSSAVNEFSSIFPDSVYKADKNRTTPRIAVFCAMDDDKNRVCDTVAVEVLNRPPEASGPLVALKDTMSFLDTLTLTPPTFTDPDGNLVDSLWWDLDGDGTIDRVTPLGVSVVDSFPNPAGGTYTVTVTSKDALGATTTISKTITVPGNRAPVASGALQASKTNPSFLDTLTLTPPTFTDPAGNLVDSLWWDLDGDGTTDKVTPLGVSVVDSFPNPAGGTYTVTVTSKDALGATTTTSKTITVPGNRAPVASGVLLASKTNPSFLDTLTLTPPAFTDPDGNLVDSLWWDLDGDGTTDRVTPLGVSVVDSFPNPAGGTYTVTVTSKDALGATTTISKTITVPGNRAPVASGVLQVSKAHPSFLDTLTLTPPTFTDPDGNLVDSLWWDLDGDGATDRVAPLGASVVNSFPDSAGGTYTVSVTAKDAIGLATTKSVVISVGGAFTDNRDGKRYRSVTIGRQTWMAENLNFNYKVTGSTYGNWCYLNSADSCAKYGRLYSWAAAMDTITTGCGYRKVCTASSGKVRGVCPTGWHLPSQAEWEALFTAVGGADSAAKKLKSTTGWASSWVSNGNGTDAYGFSALPSGEKYSVGNLYFESVGSSAPFWSSSETGQNNAYYAVLYEFVYAELNSYLKNYYGFAVRCIKD